MAEPHAVNDWDLAQSAFRLYVDVNDPRIRRLVNNLRSAKRWAFGDAVFIDSSEVGNKYLSLVGVDSATPWFVIESTDASTRGGLYWYDSSTGQLHKIYTNSSETLVIQPTTDSTTSIQIQDADGGVPVLNVDTTNERIGIGVVDPDERLEVNGNIHVSGGVHHGNLTTNTVTANAVTVDLSSDNVQTVDLAAATGTVTITVDGPNGVAHGALIIRQGATSQDINWIAGERISLGIWHDTEPTWSSDTPLYSRVLLWSYDNNDLHFCVCNERQSTFGGELPDFNPSLYRVQFEREQRAKRIAYERAPLRIEPVFIPFHPNQIQGLLLWLRADQGIGGTGTDGANVTSWTSIEGNAYAFSQGTASKQPLYRTTGIGGHPAVDFDGSNDLLVHGAAILTGTTGTVYIVARSDDTTTGSYQYLLSSDDVAGSSHSASITVKHLTVGSTNYLMADFYEDPGFENRVRGGTSLTASTNRILSVRSSGSAYVIRVNGADESKTVVAGSDNGKWWDDVTAKDNVTIGAQKTSSETSFFNGKIAEIIVYDNNIGGPSNPGQIYNIERYLANRYGITIP